VLKVAVHPENSSTKRDAFDRCLDPDFKVWRLVTVHGDTNLDSFHDQIIGPAMGWRRHYHAYEFDVPTSGAVFGPVNSGAIDMMHASGDYMLNAEEYDVRHVLRKKGDRLGYIYDLGDCWRHIITVLDVVEKGTVLTAESFSGDARIQATWKNQVKGDITVTGNHLLAGEINCPPEDSTGCEFGDYGSLLMKGPRHVPSDRGINWSENGIRTANDFDLSKHQKRFKEAIKNRKNPTDGNLQFMHSLSGGANSSFLGGSKQKGRKVKQGHTMNSAAQETVGRKTNMERCNACGKQKGSNSSLKLFDCSRCKTVAYCGRDCQKADWKTHKAKCVSLSATAK
jgi:hypothetical protein